MLETVTDPEVPPLPPHIEREHAKHLAKALFGGDPAARDIIRQSLESTAQELLAAEAYRLRDARGPRRPRGPGA